MLIQRNQRSAREKPAVGSGDEVILVVLPHPQHAEIDEADHVHEHLRRKLAQRPRKPLRRYGLGRWNGDAEDQDGHRNGEDAVAQSRDASRTEGARGIGSHAWPYRGSNLPAAADFTIWCRAVIWAIQDT